ncbi:MAG: thymidine kinase [Roseiflexaceae bacterium]
MTRLPNGGRIEVICGCMFSGKTEELIRRLTHVQLARQSLLAFTPRRDTRYRTGSLVSHNGQTIEAVTVAHIADIVTAVPAGTQVVAIDEVQFIESTPQEIATGCQTLADQGIRVIVAGLDQDFRAQPFTIVAELMAVAEQVDKLYAICVKCGSYATRSQRLIDGKAAPPTAPVIAVGGLDMYEARCRNCYETGHH